MKSAARHRPWSPLGVLALLALACGGGGGYGGSVSAPNVPEPDPIAPPVEPAAPVESIAQCGRVTTNVELASDLSTPGGTCLTVAANGVTIDGNGHRISAGQFAINWATNTSNVTVRNVVTDRTIQVYGEGADHNLIENSTIGALGIYMGSDQVIRNNRMTSLTIQGLNDRPPERSQIIGNTIEGPGNRLVYISPEGDGQSACVRSEHQFIDNFVHGTAAAAGDETVLLYMRCAMGNVVAGNTFRSETKARGMYLRDEADDNLIENNTVWLNGSDRGAFHMSAGNDDKHHPRGNTIRNNLFRADAGRSIWIQARDFRDNAFTGNVFWSNFSEGARIAGGSGNVFDHNTFVNRASGNLVVLEAFVAPGNRYTANIFENSGNSVYELSGAFDFGGYHGDHNVFFNRDGAVVFDATKDLAAWQAATGADGNSIEADPQFVNPASGDFRLNASSPARGKASDGSDAGAGVAGAS